MAQYYRVPWQPGTQWPLPAALNEAALDRVACLGIIACIQIINIGGIYGLPN